MTTPETIQVQGRNKPEVDLYRRLGLSLIPIAVRSKKPIIDWKPYQRRLPTDEEVRGWFERGDNGVGIVCGSASQNLYVLDLDDPALLHENPLAEIADKTIMVRTSRGLHPYLKSLVPAPITHRPSYHLDLIGNGGFVVAPPSVHPDGTQYEFASDVRSILEVENVNKIVEWLDETHNFHSEGALLDKPLGDGEIVEGERNTRLFQAAAVDREMGLPIDAAVARAQALNQTACKPPLPLSEVSTLVRSAFSRGYFERAAAQLVNSHVHHMIQESSPIIPPEELAIITTPTTLDRVAKIQSSTIKHDDAVKKYTFLGMLLAYTEDDQVTEIYTGESSIGKSWVVLKTADLFPSEDVDILGYSSPTAFFYETGTWDKERRVNVVDKQRRVVVFLDMPHAKLLERLRPLLSHDRKVITYKATDRSERHRRRTMTAELVGYFSTFFLSAELNLDSQERTRAFLLAISDDPEKIQDTIRLYGERDKDRAKFDAQVDADPERQWLKKRIRAVRDLHVRYIKVPFAGELANEWIQEHPNLKPRDQRDFPRLLSTVKGIALLNAHHRGVDENHDITATREDAEEAKRLYAEIATSNELGLSGHTYEVLAKVIYPLTRQGETPTRRDIQGAYFKLKKRSLSQKWLTLELENLASVGLISEDQASKPYRYTVTEAAEAIVQSYVPAIVGHILPPSPHTPTQVAPHTQGNILQYRGEGGHTRSNVPKEAPTT